ncbi:MAG TPA: glycine cleavage system aminomethyltransferase GcvT [Methanomassiliicoccales archaeon]|nr:glycine cleavage system aminomethyltransferase GcvT [Methanomassiliicoccales archaeon]
MKRTPLYAEHVKLGAKIIPFAGWDMPVFYTSIIDEHVAVRKAAGAFDVSHMGDIIIRGRGARELIRRLMTNDIDDWPVGRALYGHLLDDDGVIIDDVIVYHWIEGEYLMVPNAATTFKVLDWVKAHADGQEIIDVSERLACIALQGPKAIEILEEITFYDVAGMKHFTGAFMDLFAEGENTKGLADDFEQAGFLCDTITRQCRPGTKGTVAGDYSEVGYVSRTGYTGEDGFEVLVESTSVAPLWRILLRVGEKHGLKPAGLGARDTLRLEMGYLLSGTDFYGAQTSLQTGPKWVVKLEHDFIGKPALVRQQREGDYPVLVGLEVLGKGIPRHGYEIVKDGAAVGHVTSGSLSPCLNKGIALGYVRPPYHELGTNLDVLVRGTNLPAKVVPTPFYRKKRE